jgi:hypothetical protein
MTDRLTAAASTLSLSLEADLTASVTTRVISGMVLPYGEVGYTSVGPLTAGPGSARLPEDLSRIKLVDRHQTPPVSVGYGIATRETEAGRVVDFHVPQTPEGDRALLRASARLDDALSVELSELVLDETRNPPHILDAFLDAVAQLPVPAFRSARVASVLASLHPTPNGRNGMTPEQIARLAELAALNNRTAEQEAEYQTLSQAAVQAVTTDAPPAEQTQDAPTAAAAGGDINLSAGQLSALVGGLIGQQPAVAAGLTTRAGAAQVPTGVPAGQTGTARPLTDLYAAMSRVMSGESRPEVEAALSDITQGGNPLVTPDQYAGQLWSGLDYKRRFVDLMAHGDLTSWKGTGWRWVVAPEVDDYAGDKADVPSNQPTTEDEPWTAARLAGAHDIDRKFRDFKDDEFFAAYYHAMTMSYARKSDVKARTFLVANATAGAAVVGNLLKAAATVVQRVEDATDGASADWVMVNSTDKLALLDITNDDVPAFLATWNIDPGKFIGTTGVPAGTVVAGNKNASEFKELPGSPIRVETVSIVNGGIDGGVFGYYATLLHEATGLQKATFAPA